MRKQSTRALIRNCYLRKIETAKEELRQARATYDASGLFLQDLARAIDKHGPGEPSYIYTHSSGTLSISFRVAGLQDINPLIEALKLLGYWGGVRQDKEDVWSPQSASRTIRFEGKLEIEADLKYDESERTCKVVKVGETTEVVTRPQYKIECS